MMSNNDVCPKCGKIKDREGMYCKDCVAEVNSLSRSRYGYMIRIGTCTRCRKQKAVHGKTMCKECAERFARYTKDYRRRKKMEVAN